MITVENREIDVVKLTKKVLSNRYDPMSEIPKEPEYLIKIFDETRGIDVGFGLEGSLIGVYGKPKTRKSSFIASIIAATHAKNKKFQIVTSNIQGKVLWIDTEQSETENQYFQNKMLLDMAKRKKDDDDLFENHICLKLREFDEEERLLMLDYILGTDAIFKQGELGVVVIDGIADLIYNVNEIEASKKLVTKVTTWCDRNKIPVFVALHTNKDGKDATGSLGGFINKKASYAIICEQEYEEGPTAVRTYMSRNGKRFGPVILSHDDKEVPTFLSMDSTLNAGEALSRKSRKHEDRKKKRMASSLKDEADSDTEKEIDF